MAEEKKIGTITHYFDKISVAIIKLDVPLKIGDKIKIKGHTDDFEETIESMQLNHEGIKTAKKGDEIGIKVSQKTHEGSEVYSA